MSNENQLWYPEFGLYDDPFRTNDFFNDRENKAPIIPTKQARLVQIQRGTVFIIGEPGVGKSTVLYQVQKSKDTVGEIYFAVVGTGNITEFYNELFSTVCNFLGQSGEDPLLQFLKREWFTKNTDTNATCSYKRCEKKGCEINLKIGTLPHVFKTAKPLEEHFMTYEKYCPLRLDLVHEMIRDLGKAKDHPPYKFLLDLPDDLRRKELFYLKETIREIQKTTSSVVIMVTPKQYDWLKYNLSDTFGRYPKTPFEKMSNDELRTMLGVRIEWKRLAGRYPHLFDESAVQFIVERSIRNPRRLLEICRETIQEMQLKGVKSSVDERFVRENSATARDFDFDTLVESLVQHYIETKVREKTVHESKADLETLYNYPVEEIAMGRKFRQMWKDKKIAGYSPRGSYTDEEGKVHMNVAKYFFYVGP